MQRSFLQQPLAQFDALHKAEPLLLAELLELLLELLLVPPDELLLDVVIPEEEEAAELLDDELVVPPEPLESVPFPPPDVLSNSPLVAHAHNASDSPQTQRVFFIWAP